MIVEPGWPGVLLLGETTLFHEPVGGLAVVLARIGGIEALPKSFCAHYWIHTR